MEKASENVFRTPLFFAGNGVLLTLRSYQTAMGKKEDFLRAFDRIYDRVNGYLEIRMDRLLDFVDRHRYPLIVTFSLHLLLVILIVNLTFRYYESSEARIVAVSMEELERIEQELEENLGADRVSVDVRLRQSNQSMSGFTNQAAADLGEDVDISSLKQSFSTLEEARSVTQQTNEYGQQVNIDLFSEQVKNREVDLDAYQKIDSNAVKSAVQGPYVGESSISYAFTGVVRYNIEPIPVPVYTVNVGGLVVVDIKINRAGKVVSAEVNRSRTTSPNEDAYQKAVTYARRARFNVETAAPDPQSGYIAYEFQ